MTGAPHKRIYSRIFSMRIWTQIPIATIERTKTEKKKEKLEKTAEGVNNSCRQYDFFM